MTAVRWIPTLASVAVATFVAAGTAGTARAATPCAEAQVDTRVGALPAAWQRALAALLEATRREGLPWSCTGAHLALAVTPGGGARLTVVMTDWPALEREVASPEELVPIGEALLARPSPSRAALGPETVGASPRDLARPAPPAEGVATTPEREPRLLLGALGSVRSSGGMGGGMRAVWAGGALRVDLPLDAWRLGLWARFEVPVAVLQPTLADFNATSVSLGLSVGRRLLATPVELSVALEPSLAILAMDGGSDTGPSGATGARADPRIGTRIEAALPFSGRWRGLVALDGEIAPQALASEAHRTLDPRLPTLPSYTLGASLGGGLSIR